MNETQLSTTSITKIVWDLEAWNDYCKFKTDGEKKTVTKIDRLISDILKNGLETGLGKPERLKYDLNSLFSREISGPDRLVYYQKDDALMIVQCKTHYDKV
ncbi:MAG: Txe/YoeB family addiction module toxin [Treponema sp.]|nr:Txe/YoeB family addiction module toxin [Candidatus Treponema equifaecale]